MKKICYNGVRTKSGGINMAHIITDECLSCGACADTCPVSAITEGADKYVIDPDVCVDCGACEDGCPVGAIKAE